MQPFQVQDLGQDRQEMPTTLAPTKLCLQGLALQQLKPH